MKNQIRIFNDVEELNRAAATEFVRRAREAVAAQGRFNVALSGGSTPKKLYELLANHDASYRNDVPWAETHLFFGDERFVLPDHPDSNYRMASEAMLKRVSVPDENVHRMPTEDDDADQVARAYERELRRVFRIADEAMPRFDLVLLGLGTDGHTASLFPNTTALEERQRLVVANRVEQLGAQRLTLTFPVINNAAVCLFLVSGSEKADVLLRILEAQHGNSLLPAQLVHPVNGKVLWFIDRAAASELQSVDETAW